jgi:hypothetical protein
MNSKDRFWKAFRLEEPDRVPVSPFIYYFAASLSGTTIHDFIWSVDHRHQALMKTYEYYEKELDALHLHTPRFAFTSPFPSCYSALYFDWHFIKGSVSTLPQFILGNEDETIYDRVLEAGFTSLIRLGGVDFGDITENEREWERQKSWLRKWDEEDVVNLAGPMTTVPADVLVFARGMDGFIDFLKCPEKIREVNEAMTPGFISWSENLAEDSGIKIQRVSPQNFSADFVSPKMFEELCWPWLKSIVLTFIQDGYIVLLHLDGRWEPMFDFFQDFPPGKILLELENSDLAVAKKKLGNVLCIKGNVSPSLLAFGTTAEVEDCCKKLIDSCASGGGFILSSGCEVPINAKPDNIKAMIKVAREYGKY